MASFCSKNIDVITAVNYNDKYPGASCLPNNGAGWPVSSVDSNSGLVSSSLVDSQIATLLGKPVTTSVPGYNNGPSVEVSVTYNAPSLTEASRNHPQTDTSPAAAFSNASAKLRTNIESEYCFYYKRYIYILTEVLQIAASSNTRNLASDSGYQEKKANTEAINAKLNQILQILQGLINSRLRSLNQYYGQNSGVNQVNQELDQNRQDLLRHTNLLKNHELEKDVQSAMITYTIEKNSSSRNLMAIYGFLNIVAVGMIFYLYRNARS